MASVNNASNTPSAADWWRSFINLNWYDELINFLFRFVAKTSEPLLAAGLIISAVDFLQKGQLLTNNPQLSMAWSIAQGLAMEASVGPVLVCALDAFEQQDKIKGWLYTVLSGMLALVGGMMLLLQLIASVSGIAENQVPTSILFTLFGLRVVASVGYIALSCTKTKRFSRSAMPAANVIEELRSEFARSLQESSLALSGQLDSMRMQIATMNISIQQAGNTFSSINDALSSLRSTAAIQETELNKLTNLPGTLSTLQEAIMHQDTELNRLANERENYLANIQRQVRHALATELPTTTPGARELRPAVRRARHGTAPHEASTIDESNARSRVAAYLETHPGASGYTIARNLKISSSTASKWKKDIEEKAAETTTANTEELAAVGS